MNIGKDCFTEVPADTYQAARQIYNLQNVYLTIGDRFVDLFAMVDMRLLDPQKASNIETVSRLMIVTALQYTELVPDQVASNASRKRIDWKYALRLPVHHPGYPAEALCRFRQRVYAWPQALSEYERFVQRLGETGLFPLEQQAPLAAATILKTVCHVSRLNQLHSCMKEALTALAAAAPDWLLEHMPPYWFTRYKTGPLSQLSFSKSRNFEEEAQKYGTDIQILLQALGGKNQPPLEELAETQQVKRIFAEQFLTVDDRVQWQRTECANCTGQHHGQYPF